MDEVQWSSSADPMEMLQALGRKGNRRKLRLYACAAARRAFPGVPDPFRDYLDLAERYADGLLSTEAFQATELQDPEADAGKQAACLVMLPDALEAARQLAEYAIDAGAHRDIPQRDRDQLRTRDGLLREMLVGDVGRKISLAVRRAAEAQADLLREIVGNPFRPVALDPAWLTWNGGGIAKLAQAIYDGRAFDRMPDLADALAAAGCTDPAILAHCRSAGEHVPGCWVIDALLASNPGPSAGAAPGRTAGVAANAPEVDPLHEAVGAGDAAGVRAALASGIDPNRAGADGVTPLARAADGGRLDLVRALVEGGANVDDESGNPTGEKDLGDQVTPLLVAGWRNHRPVYEYLRRRAGKEHASEVKERLLEVKKKRNRKLLRDPRVKTLFKAVEAGDTAAVAALVAGGVELNAGNDEDWGNTALATAVLQGHAAIVQLLLDGGADPNGDGYSGIVPLPLAPNAAIAQALLRAGADPNRGSDGATPLAVATGRNLPDVVAALIAAGADLDAPTEPHGCALSMAGAAGRLEVVRLLLGAGASVHTCPKEGWPPLMYAAAAGNEQVVRALLAAGADVSFTDRDGETPLSVANEHPAVVSLLTEAGSRARNRRN